MRTRWLHHYLVLALDMGYVVPRIYCAWSANGALHPLCKLTVQDQVDYVQLALCTPATRFSTSDAMYFDFTRYHRPGYNLIVHVFPASTQWHAYAPQKYGMWTINTNQCAHAASGWAARRWEYQSKYSTVLLDDIVALLK